ncbi:hypothetical protein JAAARDRAFT_142640 [Jaapia argillacea MUCL 33604]|uniref:Uncharacterized protein n=1 Tax=Jaapia argillacea MUCL 33604 TaxID=933084 RepID=A0A067PG41_9AGAM|nr:hypothetical protein JAAARDRAFT_142640 [Jaapia argillacea MUCL 33604]
MPRILSDPTLIECPDYASNTYAAARAHFVNDHLTDEQAIELLKGLWKAGNDDEQAKWIQQVEQDAGEAAEQERLRREVADNAAQAQEVEEATARREEMRKNKAKYLPIPRRDGLYVEMYFYTNAGLRDALWDSGTVGDEAMVMTHQSDGNTGWTPAAAVRSGHVVDDKDMAWEDFCQAAPRMVIAMQQAGWPDDRIQMLAEFWGSLQIHELRASPDPLDQKTLLVYQADQRIQWHRAITAPQGAYDISRISNEVMNKTRDQVYRDDRRLKDRERDLRVRICVDRPMFTHADKRFSNHQPHNTHNPSSA